MNVEAAQLIEQLMIRKISLVSIEMVVVCTLSRFSAELVINTVQFWN